MATSMFISGELPKLSPNQVADSKAAWRPSKRQAALNKPAPVSLVYASPEYAAECQKRKEEEAEAKAARKLAGIEKRKATLEVKRKRKAKKDSR